jgi:hypothetical protein
MTEVSSLAQSPAHHCRERPLVIATATQLGQHLDLTRQRIAALADEHVIERLPDDFAEP